MKDAGKKRNRVVPVARRRTDASARGPRPGAAIPRTAPFSAAQTLTLVIVLVLLLLGIALPLRNYFQQRSDIAQTQSDIANKEKRKEELLAELDKYNSKAYVEEQARNRLNVVKEGETAFRIVDPAMDSDSSVTSAEGETQPESDAWYTTVWRSIADSDADLKLGGVNKQQEEQQPEQSTQLPIEPTQAP